ncbi:MAG: carboxypeptidase-like regulatory domain-containing protein, partial [Anaerolineae bacterium]
MENGRRILSLLVAVLTITAVGVVLGAVSAGSLADPSDALDTDMVTVSGTVTGPGGAAATGVWIGVRSDAAWVEAYSDASGTYSISLETSDQLLMHVRPEIATRLTQINQSVHGVAGDLTVDFALVEGNLLDLQVTGSGGSPVTSEIPLEVQPLMYPLTVTESIRQGYQLDWEEGLERYQAVLPPDVYYTSARYPPSGYYGTSVPFDLRASDQETALPLNTSFVHRIPYNPPDAANISIGPAGTLGEATVTGSAGAALPLAHVLLVNLNTNHQAHTFSESDGSFSATIYAPPGSAIMIKHGPPHQGRWNNIDLGAAENLNPFPGTVIHVPHAHAGDEDQMPFAVTGAIDFSADDINETRNWVSSAWALTGTVGPVENPGLWTRVLTGTYEGETVPGLYLGGLNWTHPALADLDEDGDLDLVVGEEFGHLVLYRNHGGASSPDWRFETEQYAGVDTKGWSYPALADVTGDGAPDLFVGAGDDTLLIMVNDGTAVAPVWPDTADEVLSIGTNPAPALDDLNGDGLLDLLVGYWDDGANSKLVYFANTGSLTDPAWTKVTNGYAGIAEPGAEGAHPAFVDLEDDGDRDLLLGLCGWMIWYERDGNPSSPTWTRHAEDPIGYGGGSCGNSPASGDWDDDGDDDLVIGEHWGFRRFFRNDAPPSGLGTSSAHSEADMVPWTEQTFPFPFDVMEDSSAALGDWNGDQVMDLLIGDSHGRIHAVRNDGGPSGPDWRPEDVVLTLPWTNHPHPFPALADIDGDGDLDLFVGVGSHQGPEAGGNVRYYSNDGTATVPDWNLVTADFLGLEVGGWSTPAFADIDDDADLDLFVGDSEGTLTFVENTGTATAPAWAVPVQPYAGLQVDGYAAPAFMDVDQDDDLDLLVGQGSGWLAYVRNVGSPGSPAWALVATRFPGINVGAHAVPTTGDLDGDGLLDLLIGEGSGGLNLYLYEGPASPPAGSSTYQPGDMLGIRGGLRIRGPAITATTDVEAITIHSWVYLRKLFDEAGQPLAGRNFMMSTMLTPSGFPVQRPNSSAVGWQDVDLHLGDLSYLGGHTLGAALHATGILPQDLEPGIYRPVVLVSVLGVPHNETRWVAATVTRDTYGYEEAVLPPITVGPVTPPRLIWRLLADDFVQGTRGAGAREDAGIYELSSDIVSQGAPYYAPPVDVWTGESITYRLEPYLPMISFTDRRMPTPPLLPFDLPGGDLCVVVGRPDGTQDDLGCEPFAQSHNRTKTTRAGFDLNAGTVQLEDVYSLRAATDRFHFAADQFGRHVITMTGVISDLWGNPYTGGGTYDVWFAEPLDIDPGVLPGTPLALGDAFNPTLRFYPRVPADVSLQVALYPDSDPAQVITYTVEGQANQYGAFSPSEAAQAGSSVTVARLGAASGGAITLTHPGELRVDVTASYTAADGSLFMGTMTWGGVVMTPDDEADLVAHGRRGLDSLTSIPGAWFLSSELDIPAGAVSHTFNPYHPGDLLWSRMSDGAYGGDSLLLAATVEDRIGTIKAAIQDRIESGFGEIAGPGTVAERFAAEELPLFTNSRTGVPAHLLLGRIGEEIPPEIDQIAYSYRSSQRPGVRVREVIAEDAESGGYWRLDTLYDDQLGVGVQGDQPNDFKFQYVGAVFRDLDSGRSEYVGQGTGWIFIPDEGETGSRVMPPYAGLGNGGWTTDGGPILTLLGE